MIILPNITVRSRAPLRLGFAGGGTDVAPYCDRFGGCVLNSTIDLFANCTIEHDPMSKSIEFHALDINEREIFSLQDYLAVDGELRLHRAIYNRIIRDYMGGEPIPLKISTWVDAPPGSGLGTSSTLVVSIIAAYVEILSLPLGEYDIANLAYEIERIDCGLAGGKQDQYAATFGGFNFMEFSDGGRVIVNPLRIRRNVELELQSSLLLYFTGRSRESAKIIQDQVSSVDAKGRSDNSAIEAMHKVKSMAYLMKESVLRGDINGFHSNLAESWSAKKQMANSISNIEIESIAQRALEAGAKAIKISGAGGGGFMMISVDPVKRHRVMEKMKGISGKFHDFEFTNYGIETWKVR